MPERTSYAPGTPSWVDIGTDLDAAIPFYTQLFGWSAEAAGPPEETGGYGMFKKNGKDVAGYGPQQNPGPPAWSLYVTVADIEDAAATVAKAAGTVVMPPMDVMSAGRMAVCMDAQGGFFSLWQAGEHIGAQLVSEPGAFCWSELQTRDVAGSKQFYETVFGWSGETHEIGPPMGSYTEFALGGQTLAGMMPMPPMVPAEVPTYWLVYFAVDDCDAQSARAQELGATVLVPPMDVDAGRFSVLMDPQGATFGIIKLVR
jgi:predicted enzyme related to lactoylglutathione lyase